VSGAGLERCGSMFCFVCCAASSAPTVTMCRLAVERLRGEVLSLSGAAPGPSVCAPAARIEGGRLCGRLAGLLFGRLVGLGR